MKVEYDLYKKQHRKIGAQQLNKIIHRPLKAI